MAERKHRDPYQAILIDVGRLITVKLNWHLTVS